MRDECISPCLNADSDRTTKTSPTLGSESSLRPPSHAPTTRYQGSKRKILPWMWEHLKDLDFESALDAFGGTGSVSFLLKRMGKKVTYNDCMRWNYLVGIALIENDSITLSDHDLERLCQPVTRADADFVSRSFRGMYYTERENLWIDALVSRIRSMTGHSSIIKYKTAIAYYALFQTCLVKRPFNMFHRANLSLRLADVDRSFGNKTTWDKPFAQHFRAFTQEIQRFIFRGRHSCHATNHDATRIPTMSYDLVYLDPPYLKAGQRSETANYQRCYHFLEGLARYSEWPTLIDYSSRLRAISTPENNPWNDPRQNVAAFDKLFENFGDSTIVVSYKKFGAPSIDTLVRMLKRRGKKVSVHTRHYTYALNRHNGTQALNRECLIIAK